MFVKRKLPSVLVVVSRWKPLTEYVISTVAPAMEEPDGSLTVPSIDPEFPCAKPHAARNSNTTAKIEIRVRADLPQREYRELQKFRSIFSPVPSIGTYVARGDWVDVWIRPLEIQRWRRNSKRSEWGYK